MSSLTANTSRAPRTSRWSDAAEHGHHDARLMQMLLRITPITAVVDIVLGLLTVWLVYPERGWGLHMVWPIGLSAASCLYAIDSIIHLGRPLEDLGRPAVRWRFTLHSLLIAVMFSGIAIFLFPVAGPDCRFLLAVMACGCIPFGTVSLAPMRRIALPWLLVMSTGVLIGLARIDPFVGRITAAMLLMMDLLLVASVRSISGGVTARLLAETAALRDRQSLDLLLRDFEAQADDWLWETDLAGQLRHVSSRMARALGFDEAERLIGHRLTEVLGRWAEVSALSDVLRGAEPFRGLDLSLVPGYLQNTPRVWSFSGVPVFDNDGVPSGWRGLVRDVTLLREQAHELSRLAHTDVLTGLSNRHVLQQRSAEAVARCVSSGGRAGGPEVPIRLTLCLIDHPLWPMERDERVDSLLVALRPTWVVESLRVEVRASVGVASWSSPASDADAHADRLFQNADLALYEAKDSGRDRAFVFDVAMRARMHQRTQLLRDLDLLLTVPGAVHAVAGQLLLHYQPQFALADGRLVGAEALLRWRHPRRGWIEPSEFIPLAEETGLIVPLGEWALRQACAEAAGWPASVRLAVNLSAAQLGRDTLEAVGVSALADSGLPAQRLELEITETALMHDPNRALATVQSLRALGLGIALDDFGTGYSSLAQLATLPVDTLKIDRSFVAALGHPGGEQAEAIVRLIVQLGRTMGMRTLAEGVETPRQREVLRACGCDPVQGFESGRPVEPGVLRGLLNSESRFY